MQRHPEFQTLTAQQISDTNAPKTDGLRRFGWLASDWCGSELATKCAAKKSVSNYQDLR